MSRSPPIGNLDVASLVEDMNLQRIAQYALVVFFLGLFLVPLETGIMTAIRTDESVTRSPPFASPVGEGFTLENIQFALEQFSGSSFNPSIMSIPATIGSVLLGSMAVYGLTMVNWRAQMGMLILFVAGVFTLYQTVLAPPACFWNSIFLPARTTESMVASISFFQGYHAELVPLVITHVTYEIPICTILFRSHCQNLPDSLAEAGKIDDASITKIYRHIILPISKPMFGVVFIYQFTQIYNELLFALTLVTGSDAPAVSVTLVLLVIGTSTSGISFGVRTSAMFLVTVPTLILYVAFAEQLAKGLRAEA